jgi:hypothetical protein
VYVTLFGLAMAAVSAALFAGAIAGRDRVFDSEQHLPWLVLAAAFVLAETCALHLRFRGNTQTFTPDEILIVIGLFALAPSRLVFAYLAGGGVALGIIRRIKLFKLFFNLCQWALSSTVAIVVFRGLAASGSALAPQNWLAALAATAVAAMVSMTVITIAIMMLEGRPAITDVARSGRRCAAHALGLGVRARAARRPGRRRVARVPLVPLGKLEESRPRVLVLGVGVDHGRRGFRSRAARPPRLLA